MRFTFNTTLKISVTYDILYKYDFQYGLRAYPKVTP